MRRLILTSMLVTGGLLAASCTGDRERVPTQGPSFSSGAPANHGQVEELIAKLFPPGDLRKEANDRLQAIQSALVHGDVTTARALAIGPGGLVAFAVQQFAAGRLQEVKGVSPDPYLVDLINAIYEYVGLVGPIPESAKGSDGAIAVVGPEGGDVFTETRHAEINIPAGALNEDVLVTIGRLPDAPVPLPTDLDQFPLFYDFATFPDVPKFNVPVIVALCVVDQGLPFDVVSRLRLAHPRRPDRTTIEILPLADREGYPNLSCGGVSEGTGSGGGLAQRLRSAAQWLFAPPPLHAATVVRPGGLGGSADNLSPFGAVDPGKLVFTVQPISTSAGAPITPPVEVTVERANGSTITSFSGTITIALGNNPGEGALSGTTTVTPVAGVARFVDLSIDSPAAGYTLVASAVSALGEPPAAAMSAPFDITSVEFVQLSVGFSHTCGLTGGGAAYCWGSNVAGQLGDGTTTNRSRPVAVRSGLKFLVLGAGIDHTCGLTTAGAAWCWGDNQVGQLGDGTTTNRSRPVAVIGGLAFVGLSGGGNHNCGVTSGGVVWCWGLNVAGQLGDGTTTNRLTPVPITSDVAFVALIARGSHTCGLTGGGAAWCWGSNFAGELGDGTTLNRSTPVAVTGELTFVALAAGGSHTCGLTSERAAWCWGFNASGQLGDGTMTNRSTPTAVTGELAFVALAARASHTCGLTSGGAAWCWGDNVAGDLGDGTTTSRSSPVAVTGDLVFVALSAGGAHTCGLTDGGAAWCWGYNLDGELGDGTTTNRFSPVRVVEP